MNKDELADYCKEASNEIIRQDEEIRKLKKENQELKKQVEETRKCLKDMYHINIENDKELEKLKTQQKEVIDRKKYLLKEQGAELKELYSEIDKLQGIIDKAMEYLEAPNRDSFDYSKAKLLDILDKGDIRMSEEFKIPYQDLTDININNLIVERNTLIQEYQKALDETMSEKIDIENNWNKLKEYIIETRLKEFEKSYGKSYGETFIQAELIMCNMILNKMIELEKGSDE